MIGLTHTTFPVEHGLGRGGGRLWRGLPSLLLLALLLVPLGNKMGGMGWAQSVPALSVPLQRPAGVAFDQKGNLYIAETNNHAIRRVTPAGAMTTVAGDGVQGFGGDGGPAVEAQLDSPSGVAIDAAQNLYLTDTHNQRIRRVDAATGTITTIAGTGVSGFSGDEGPATAAALCLPTAVALDAAGDVYFSDNGNHRLREIVAATGVVVTVAGDGVQGYAGDGGVATAAEIDSPDGVAVDAVGRLYLADTHNQRVRVVDLATGKIATLAGTGVLGSGGDGAAAGAAILAMPRGVAVDAAGNVYFADMSNHRIRRVDGTTGGITTVAGDGVQGYAGDGGAATAASLDLPQSVAVVAGQVTLADAANARVRQVAANGSIATVAGLSGTVPETLTLAGPAVVGYGQGSVTVMLAGTTAASGQVQLLDVRGNARGAGHGDSERRGGDAQYCGVIRRRPPAAGKLRRGRDPCGDPEHTADVDGDPGVVGGDGRGGDGGLRGGDSAADRDRDRGVAAGCRFGDGGLLVDGGVGLGGGQLSDFGDAAGLGGGQLHRGDGAGERGGDDHAGGLGGDPDAGGQRRDRGGAAGESDGNGEERNQRSPSGLDDPARRRGADRAGDALAERGGSVPRQLCDGGDAQHDGGVPGRCRFSAHGLGAGG
jgi:sugar lactone lactonase YvrE